MTSWLTKVLTMQVVQMINLCQLQTILSEKSTKMYHQSINWLWPKNRQFWGTKGQFWGQILVFHIVTTSNQCTTTLAQIQTSPLRKGRKIVIETPQSANHKTPPANWLLRGKEVPSVQQLLRKIVSQPSVKRLKIERRNSMRRRPQFPIFNLLWLSTTRICKNARMKMSPSLKKDAPFLSLKSKWTNTRITQVPILDLCRCILRKEVRMPNSDACNPRR